MKKRAIQILLALSLIFLQINLVLESFQSPRKALSTSKSWIFSDSAFDGERSSFLSGHLSTGFAGKKIFSFQVAAEVLHLPFTGLHHFIYVWLPLFVFHIPVFKSDFFEWNDRNDGETGVLYFLLIVCFIAPIAEELIYRGVLMTTFFKTHLGTEMFCFLLLFSVIFISILL